MRSPSAAIGSGHRGDCLVAGPWNIQTTHGYIEADLSIKEQALQKVAAAGQAVIWPRKRVQAVAQFWLLLDKCKGLVTLSWFLLFFDILVCFNPITIRCAQGRNPA